MWTRLVLPIKVNTVCVFKEDRVEKMDHFFNCVATLMSNLLRSCVINSITDLIDLVEEYFEGNEYEGQYTIFKDLALPQKIHPVKFFLVSGHCFDHFLI